MYLTPSDKHWSVDLEADNLLDKATTIWCVCAINCVTKVKKAFVSQTQFNDWQKDNPDAIYVGHNFISYDAPMLNRFWGANIPIRRIIDTYVLSQLYSPSLPGGHSLRTWGERLRYPKTDFDDFSAYSEKMAKYCMNDTILTAFLFRKLTERMRMVGFSEQGAEIEHLAWSIVQNKQKRNGFPFDKQRAEELYATLRHREEELKNEIYELWPPQLVVVGTYRNPYKKNGDRSANYIRHCEQFPRVDVSDEAYYCYDYVAFNLGSPSQRIEKLLELGWKPVNFTKKTKTGGGNPKVDEDELLSFAELSGKKEVAALAKWIVTNSRANMVRTWLDAYNETTGAIHGSLFIASTLRYRHSSPNSANIPAVRLKKDDDGNDTIQYAEAGAWTHEARDLWTCGDSRRYDLVGIDGTGIQNRCLIHHLIKTVGEDAVREFKELALAGDVHKRNIEVLGLANKAAAKKFYYTLMMGGGGARLAADQAQFGTKLTPKEGDYLKDKMIATIPGFGLLIKDLQDALEKTGRIRLCDDTPIVVSSPHMVIPYLLQGDESRLMKKAMILVDEEVRKRKLSKYVYKVADIHDEWQYRTAVEVTKEFIDFALPCFPLAGISFNYNIVIEGDSKIGKTWAQTH